MDNARGARTVAGLGVVAIVAVAGCANSSAGHTRRARLSPATPAPVALECPHQRHPAGRLPASACPYDNRRLPTQVLPGGRISRNLAVLRPVR